MPIPRVLLRALILGTAAAVTLLPTPAAFADPTPGNVDSQIEQAADDLENVIEAYNAVTEHIKATQTEIASLTSWIQQLRGRLDDARQAVATLAAAAYRNAGELGTATVMLDASSPDALLDRMAQVRFLSRSQRREISHYTNLAAINDADQRRLQELLASQTRQQGDLAARRTTIEAKLRDLEGLKQRLNSPPSPPAASAATTGATTGAPPTTPPPPTSPPTPPPDPATRPAPPPSTPSGRGGTPVRPNPSGNPGLAVAFARAQLGKPYVYGTAGPDSYDCSGLTMAAWAAAGVSLPHNAAMQWAAVGHLPRSALRPGDLVFYRNLGHVAIYIGDGSVIHAPQTGDVVRIAPIDARTPYGYGRPG